MTNTPNPGTAELEKELERIIGHYEGEGCCLKLWKKGAKCSCDTQEKVETIKALIAQQRQQAKQELLTGIGFLRQWLNEDRITNPEKMVTNEQIEHMLITGVDALLGKEVTPPSSPAEK